MGETFLIFTIKSQCLTEPETQIQLPIMVQDIQWRRQGGGRGHGPPPNDPDKQA
jgi:hypothetical protein